MKKENIKKNLISVIIPIHSYEDINKRCLRAVLESTYKRFEIILIFNNKSSLLLFRQDPIKNNKIKILKKFDNSSPATLRNYGIIHANGEYIAIVDSDDIISKTHFYEAVNALISNLALLYFSSYVNFYTDYGIIEKRIIKKKTVSLFDLLTFCPIGHSTTVFKYPLRPKYKRLRYRHDLMLWYELIIKNKISYAFSNKISCLRLITKNSHTFNKFLLIKYYLYIFKVVFKKNLLKTYFYFFFLVIRNFFRYGNIIIKKTLINKFFKKKNLYYTLKLLNDEKQQ